MMLDANIIPLMPRLEENQRARVAIFMSGQGSNAEKILQQWDAAGRTDFEVCLIFTDSPEISRAYEIGSRFNVPVVANDIRAFYQEHGLSRVSLKTEEGREARAAWTEAVWNVLKTYELTFGVFAGFVPLTNITGKLPCLNVHPGDLTYIKNQQRYLVGLHTVPIERAILEELPDLYSSVIVARPYTGVGSEMDSGHILGLSPPVPIDLQGHSIDELAANLKTRPSKRPKGGFGDTLERVAQHNLDRLKQHGDWIVMPRVVKDFAKASFGENETHQQLFYRLGKGWHPIKTVVYEANNDKEIIFEDADDRLH